MNEYVLITGASSGIGKALAYEYAKHRHNLILVARRKELLETLAADIRKNDSINVIVYAVDLTEEGAAKKIYAFCNNHNLVVDTLINNAGMGAQGIFTDLSLERQKAILSLNITVVLELSHIFLKDMKARGKGTLVNIASTTAFMPLANESIYAASKAFILSLSQALYEEMKPFGVTVCTVCPGVTDTGFFESAGFTLQSFKGANPNDFARYAYQRVAKKKPLSVHGFTNRMIALWARLFPRNTVRKVSAKFG